MMLMTQIYFPMQVKKKGNGLCYQARPIIPDELGDNIHREQGLKGLVPLFKN